MGGGTRSEALKFTVEADDVTARDRRTSAQASQRRAAVFMPMDSVDSGTLDQIIRYARPPYLGVPGDYTHFH